MVKTWAWHLPVEVARHRLIRPGTPRQFPAAERRPATLSADTLCHRLICQCAAAIVEGKHPRVDMLEVVKMRLRERETV